MLVPVRAREGERPGVENSGGESAKCGLCTSSRSTLWRSLVYSSLLEGICVQALETV